jgi:hypothetical protein|tara:strand:+ start:325 stop:495 length:171 start_codon:yes stop_codon:yes gene_type:complete
MKEWRVYKTVTEYHYFTIEAETLEEAEIMADGDDCYCDSGSSTDVDVETISVLEVE